MYPQFFTGQHKNPTRNAKRQEVRALGRRQQRRLAALGLASAAVAAGAERETGQHPKFAKARTHKPHQHPLRDAHGDAYTLTGQPAMPGMPRRVWVAGISAQRGY